MRKLNIEAGRLNGWIKSPQEASKEMGIPLKDMIDYFDSNQKITLKHSTIFRIESRMAG